MTQTTAVTDFGQFSKLRAAARDKDPEALRAAAKQFEALFTQQLLKSMREAKLGDDPMAGDQGEFYQGMFDQQLSMQIASGKGLGIADMLVRQLQGPATAETTETARQPGLTLYRAEAAAPTTTASGFKSPEDFVTQMLPHAEKAAKTLGISARTLVAQAALETGWGKKVIRNADGTPSNNLFGIKADSRWDGARTSTNTQEFVAGRMQTQRAEFRSYGSIAESFEDYARFLQSNPRYRTALAHGGSDQQFTVGLQKAGYATDPDYASKIQRIAGGRTMVAALGRSTVTA